MTATPERNSRTALICDLGEGVRHPHLYSWRRAAEVSFTGLLEQYDCLVLGPPFGCVGRAFRVPSDDGSTHDWITLWDDPYLSEWLHSASGRAVVLLSPSPDEIPAEGVTELRGERIASKILRHLFGRQLWIAVATRGTDGPMVGAPAILRVWNAGLCDLAAGPVMELREPLHDGFPFSRVHIRTRGEDGAQGRVRVLESESGGRALVSLAGTIDSLDHVEHAIAAGEAFLETGDAEWRIARGGLHESAAWVVCWDRGPPILEIGRVSMKLSVAEAAFLTVLLRHREEALSQAELERLIAVEVGEGIAVSEPKSLRNKLQRRFHKAGLSAETFTSHVSTVRPGGVWPNGGYMLTPPQGSMVVNPRVPD